MEKEKYEQLSVQNNLDTLSKILEQQGSQPDRHLQTERAINEILWATIFNSTINEANWMQRQVFSPSRWAAGYPFLYVLYRTLNSVAPATILELGMGQTTNMISQYAANNDGIQYYVVEHSEEWIAFFFDQYPVSDATKVVQLDWVYESYRDDEKVRVFDGFVQRFRNKKFKLIIVDAPLGSDMKKYSRIDVLKVLPGCLESSFAIIIDDFERQTEKNTAKCIQEILDENSIPHRMGIYRGNKETAVICSEDFAFLCSL